MTTAAAAEIPMVSLRRGQSASPVGESPMAGGRQVVRRNAVTSLSFELPPADEIPAEEQVSLRRSGLTAPAEPAAPDAPPAQEWRDTAGIDLKQIGKRLGNWLYSFSREKRLPLSPDTRSLLGKITGITAESIKKHEIPLWMGAGAAARAAAVHYLAPLLNIDPASLDKLVMPIGLGLGRVSLLAINTLEKNPQFETKHSRSLSIARGVSSRAVLFSMGWSAELGVEGAWNNLIAPHLSSAAEATPIPNVSIQATAAGTETQAPTSTPVVEHIATATDTPLAEPSATLPAIPDIQPTWEAGHVPSPEQLDSADSQGNMTAINIDGKGEADFYAYNLDTSDPNPEAYVHIKTGQVFYETPDGKWAVDINKDGVPDALYSESPVPDTSGSGRLSPGLASPVRSGMREGDPPSLENINLAGDSTPELFSDGADWQLDTNGDGVADQPVQVDGLVNNGGVWDWSNIKITSPDQTTEWKFEGGSWVQSDLLSPIERGVHDVNPDVTISTGEGKWHAGENYLKAILNNPVTAADTDLVGKLSEGTGANTIAADAVKDVLESNNVHTTVDGVGAYHVNVDSSYNQEIGARIEATVDKINGWFTPGTDDVDKNKILAEMSKRGLIEVKNLTVEQLDSLGKLAKALKGGG